MKAIITRIAADRPEPNSWTIQEHTNGTATLHVHDEAEVARAKALYGVVGPWPRDANGEPELRLAEGP